MQASACVSWSVTVKIVMLSSGTLKAFAIKEVSVVWNVMQLQAPKA